MLTHIPVIGVGAILAFLLVGVIRGSREIEWASLQLFVALALVSIAVYLSGSPANHQVRDLPGFSRSVIHRHSTAADFAFWSLAALGTLSLGALYLYRTSMAVPPKVIVLLFFVGFVVLLLMGVDGKPGREDSSSGNWRCDPCATNVKNLRRLNICLSRYVIPGRQKFC